MHRSCILLVVFALLLTSLFAQESQRPKPLGVFSSVKVGQAVSVKENGDSYQLTIVEGDLHIPQSHRIVEVGANWIAIEDVTGLNEASIPLTSIKAVIRFKGFVKK